MNADPAFLRKVAAFADLPQEELEAISKLFQERQYGRNDIVFFEADTGKYAYIVKEGRVKVSRVLPSGKETILAFHETGEYFGEMALIDGQTTPATVTAVIPSTILVISQIEFSKLLHNPTVSQSLLKMLCQRCRDAWAQIEVLTFHHADSRIRVALYQLCQSRGRQTERGVKIQLHLTHQELADLTGISRETATRVLNNLQNQGAMKVETRRFLILDPEKLIDPVLTGTDV